MLNIATRIAAPGLHGRLGQQTHETDRLGNPPEHRGLLASRALAHDVGGPIQPGERQGQDDVTAAALALQAGGEVHRLPEIVEAVVERDRDARPLVQPQLQHDRRGGRTR